MARYDPPGPVAAAYIRSMGPIDCITGPAGSGKTVASVFKPIKFSVGAMPVCTDGVIRVRGTVLRDNYRTLYRTTLRSWFEFFPPDYPGSTFSGGQDRPAQHVLKLATVRLVNGERREIMVDLVVDFFAVGDVAIEELLKGYETSWIWCNEGDLLHPRVIPFAFSRTGRYPSLSSLPPGTVRPRLVQVDFNPTDMDHPLWAACEAGSFNQDAPKLEAGSAPPIAGKPLPKATVNFFHQPSGLSPEAENRAGKSYEAYEIEANTLRREDVRRFVHGQPGYSSDGRPVYNDDFDIRRHRATGPLAVLPGVPLNIGFDQGLSPGAIFFQIATTSQLRVLAELIPDQGTGAARFLEQMSSLLIGRFRGLPPGVYSTDPSGFYGADTLAGELSWAQMISAGLGRTLLPAESNEPAVRIEAVKNLLTRSIDRDTPALIIDPSCKLLIGGFAAHYKFRRIRANDGDRFEDRPFKNQYATAHDALQYGVLGVYGRAGVIAEAAKAGRLANVVSLRGGPPKRKDFSVWDT